MLLDKDRQAPFISGAGHGVDKLHALLNLWQALVESDLVQEMIDYVAVEYARRTGETPTESTGTPAELTGRGGR
jgi:hypothetical protein